jgi:hypothetical protein
VRQSGRSDQLPSFSGGSVLSLFSLAMSINVRANRQYHRHFAKGYPHAGSCPIETGARLRHARRSSSNSSTWRLAGSPPCSRIDQRTAASSRGSESMVSRSRIGDSVNAQPAQRNSARPGARRLPVGRRLHRPDRLRPHGPAPRRWPSTSTPSTTPSTWPPPECWQDVSSSQPPPPPAPPSAPALYLPALPLSSGRPA